jgi:hypothetical protein
MFLLVHFWTGGNFFFAVVPSQSAFYLSKISETSRLLHPSSASRVTVSILSSSLQLTTDTGCSVKIAREVA